MATTKWRSRARQSCELPLPLLPEKLCLSFLNGEIALFLQCLIINDFAWTRTLVIILHVLSMTTRGDDMQTLPWRVAQVREETLWTPLKSLPLPHLQISILELTPCMECVGIWHKNCTWQSNRKRKTWGVEWGRCDNFSGDKSLVILKEASGVERLILWDKVAHTAGTGFLQKGHE